jgi:hypothetical protein
LLMGLHGHRSGIPAKIAMLDALANAVPQYVRVLNPEQAQAATNQSTGQYLVLAFMWDTIHAGGAEVEKHHAAIVIGGKFNSVDGPAMGGGGLNMQKIDKGWVLSNARIHFTEWGKVKYYQYGYRTDRRIV